MGTSYIRLIADKREELWNGQRDFSAVFGQADPTYDPRDHLRYIKERHGEKIVAVDDVSGQLMGWVGLFPDRDEGGLFYNLAGIEVHSGRQGQGIGTALMEQAKLYLSGKKTDRLKFGTSPLLTRCAGLYVMRFGTRYRWKEGVKGPDGQPWPYVSCECSFSDPLFKPLDLRDEEVGPRSVLEWDGVVPRTRRNITYTGPLAVTLPSLSRAELAHAMRSVPGFLETLCTVFSTLHHHGYGFAWFDRSTRGGPAPFYYVMTRLMTF